MSDNDMNIPFPATHPPPPPPEEDASSYMVPPNFSCPNQHKYIGVQYRRDTNKWNSEMRIQRKRAYMGSFITEVEAAKAYDIVAKEMSNKQLNFPEDYPEHEFVPGNDFNETEIQSAWDLLETIKPKRTRNQASEYFGVSLRTDTKKWASEIKIKGKKAYLGSFNTEIEAAKTYDIVAKELSNKKLNFPEDYPDHEYQELNPLTQEDILAAWATYESIKPIRVSNGVVSEFIGVYHRKDSGKWRAETTIQGKKATIGSFITELDAAKAYDQVAKEMSNKQLNFPEDYPDHHFIKPAKGTKDDPVEAQNALDLIKSFLPKKNEVPSSEYYGVCYDQRNKRWKAQIIVQKSKSNLGSFDTEVKAAKAYDKIAKEMSNKQLNFPEDYPEHKYIKGGKENESEASAAHGLLALAPSSRQKRGASIDQDDEEEDDDDDDDDDDDEDGDANKDEEPRVLRSRKKTRTTYV